MCLVICILVTMIPSNAFAAENKMEEVKIMDSIIREMPSITTSGKAYASYKLDEFGNPELKESNEVKWIDRLADMPEYAIEFYEWLAENSDGDKENDALINPMTGTALGKDNSIYGSYVTSVTGTEVDFTYTPGASDGEIDAAAQQAIYDTVEEVINNVDPYIFYTFCAFDRDYPEVFWLSGDSQFAHPISYTFSYTTDKDGYGKVVYDVDFYFVLFAKDEFDVRSPKYRDYSVIYNTIESRDGWIADIMTEASGNNEDKIAYFNDYLTKNNCYNTSDSLNANNIDSWECISALKGNAGTNGPVCEGYARAFKVLCDKAGIPCVLVNGEACVNFDEEIYYELHMWNNVQMNDGKWYAVDVTWNDPSVEGVSHKVSGHESEDYLLVGSNTYNETDNMTFEESHIVTNILVDDGVAFINGPELEKEAYVPHVHADLQIVEGYSATCKEEGQKTYYICSCGQWFEDENATALIEDHDSVVLEKVGHDYKTATTEPTCTEEGYTIHACAVCNDSYIDNYVEAKGHVFEEWTQSIAPTCTEKGEETSNCFCGEKTTREVEALGHSYDVKPEFVWSKDYAECKAVFTCSRDCDSTYETDCVVTATTDAHSCTEAGNVKYVASCTMNEVVYTDSHSVKGIVLGHQYNNPQFIWEDDNTACTAVFACANCDVVAVNVKCTVEMEETADEYVYTATCEFEGKSYSKTITEPIIKEPPFPDVSPERYSFEAIIWAAENGITTGTNGYFRPFDTCTREEVVTFLWRAMGCPEPTSAEKAFPDVKDNYALKAIAWAAENKITTGTNGLFRPEDTCTREEVMTFIWRTVGKPEATSEEIPFPDVKDNYAREAIIWAEENGITTGTNGKFRPEDTCTREEVVTFLYRQLIKNAEK